MSKHEATIRWQNGGPDFPRGKYSREHTWTFDGGICIDASPSPSVVPMPWSNPAHVDPEEAFVAAISSCHMLTFLWLAAKRRLTVMRYVDHAVGTMSKNERGVSWVDHVELRPEIVWEGAAPTQAVIDELHHHAHEQCFIAASVKTNITVGAAVSAST